MFDVLGRSLWRKGADRLEDLHELGGFAQQGAHLARLELFAMMEQKCVAARLELQVVILVRQKPPPDRSFEKSPDGDFVLSLQHERA
jgi:hypothetical protein